jgi:predicted transcriptional regulator
MELAITPEQEAHLARIAEHQGKTPSQLVFDATIGLIQGDRLFRAAVQRGIEQAEAGDFLEEEEMDARFEKMIRG